MQGAEWARLSHPFPTEAFGWYVVELSLDRTQARLSPYLRTAAVVARLDELFGLAGWSFQLLPSGERALVCNLTVAGVSRAAVATPPAVDPELPARSNDPAVLAELALSEVLEMFGVTVPAAADGGWVDYDEAADEPLYTPQLVDGVPHAAPVPLSPIDAGPLTAPISASLPTGAVPTGPSQDAVSEQRPDGHLVIDRLLERLKAEGLGKEAAKLVVSHHGYGRTPEEARELYGKLRGLLLDKQEVAP